MIQANELRIGNWVQMQDVPNGSEMPGSMFQWDSAHWWDVETSRLRVSMLNPIPLTPEILEKCGFHKHNNAWVLDDFSETDYNKDFFTIWNIHDGNYHLNTTNFPVELHSLHQLQNLYFALTGTELNIEL